jgi:Conserved hypothetical phage protein (DUF2376).
MGLATMNLRWSPQTFWSATPHEFFAAWEIFVEMNKRD